MITNQADEEKNLESYEVLNRSKGSGASRFGVCKSNLGPD